MNKKIITLAVAAAMATPAAALADAVLYGKVHATIDYIDADQNSVLYGPGATGIAKVPVASNSLLVPDTIFVTEDENGVPTAAQIIPGGVEFDVTEDGFLLVNGKEVGVEAGSVVIPPDTEDFTGWNTASRASRLGVKGSEDLGGGLKAIYKLELEIPMLNNDTDIDNGDNSSIRMRNSYVGLKGNFGTFLVGRHDTPHKLSTADLDLFNDTIVDYKEALGFHDVRADNTVTYMSPNFNGFSFMGSLIPSGGITPIGTGVPGESPDGFADAYSLAAIYKNGPFYFGAGYERLGEDHWNGLEAEVEIFDNSGNLVEVQDAYNGIPNYGSAENWDKWRVGLGILDWNGFYLTGIYEQHSNVYGAPESADMDIWQVQAGYKFGNNMIKGSFGQNDLDSCVGTFYSKSCAPAQEARYGVSSTSDVAFLNNRDFDNWTVGFDHYFSKRTTAYALYTQTSSDQKNSDWSAFSLGMIHEF